MARSFYLVRMGVCVVTIALIASPSAAVTLINVAESGYKYCICPFEPGMADVGFDDSSFQTAKAPICNLPPACAPLQGTYLGFGSLVVRRQLLLSGSPANTVLTVQFHSGADVFVNDRLVGKFGTGCEYQSNSTALFLPDGLLHSGENVIVVAVISTFNSGIAGYFDLLLEADGATAIAQQRSWGSVKAMYR